VFSIKSRTFASLFARHWALSIVFLAMVLRALKARLGAKASKNGQWSMVNEKAIGV
jgi:hypothetical protein